MNELQHVMYFLIGGNPNMNFKLIDMNNWKRLEYFNHYISDIPCTYSLTTKIDISKLINSKKKLYPAMLYYLTLVVNRHEEFRMSFDETGRLGVFEKMYPCYTVFHKESETFSNIWTEFCENMALSFEKFEHDMSLYGSLEKMNAKPDVPPNVFPVSMIPWTSFESFNLNLKHGYDYLLPIFTMGKYYIENDKYILPLAMQVHHAVCDGFHISRFINELKDLVE